MLIYVVKLQIIIKENKINYHNLIVFDFETGSRNPYKTQPIQLGAVAIDCRKLTIMPNGAFNSLMRPIFDDDKAREMGVDPLEDEALAVNKLTREQLVDAPLPETVWKNFIFWANQFNRGGGTGEWNKPIPAGYNIINFDLPIVRRLCEQYKTPYPFHPIHVKDVMNDIWTLTENVKVNDSNSLSMDAIRKWLGIDETGSHSAIKDVYDTGFLLIKLLKMNRYFFPKIKFKDSFAKENEEIKHLMKIL